MEHVLFFLGKPYVFFLKKISGHRRASHGISDEKGNGHVHSKDGGQMVAQPLEICGFGLSHQRFGWWFPDWFQADTCMDVMYCYVGLPKGLGDTPCCCNLNC